MEDDQHVGWRVYMHGYTSADVALTSGGHQILDSTLTSIQTSPYYKRFGTVESSFRAWPPVDSAY